MVGSAGGRRGARVAEVEVVEGGGGERRLALGGVICRLGGRPGGRPDILRFGFGFASLNPLLKKPSKKNSSKDSKARKPAGFQPSSPSMAPQGFLQVINR